MGWYRPAHRKAVPSQELRATLVGRKLLDGDQALRGILLKVGLTTKLGYATHIRELVAGHAMLERLGGSMVRSRSALRTQSAGLHRRLPALVRGGAMVAVAFTSALDAPGRFAKSRTFGTHFRLTLSPLRSVCDATGGRATWGDTNPAKRT